MSVAIGIEDTEDKDILDDKDDGGKVDVELSFGSGGRGVSFSFMLDW